MDKLTQRQKILAYCKEHGSITVREAFEKLNINSPTKRISEMREVGYEVDTTTEYREKEDGSKTFFTRYFIGPPRKQS